MKQVAVVVKKDAAVQEKRKPPWMPSNGESTMEGIPRLKTGSMVWTAPKFRPNIPSHQYGTEGRADAWVHLEERNGNGVEQKPGDKRSASIAEQSAKTNKKGSSGTFANREGGSEQIAKEEKKEEDEGTRFAREGVMRSFGMPNANASSAFRTKGVYAL